MKKIKAIRFDFDGVINDGVKVHYEFYKKLCKIHNVKPPFSTQEEFKEWFDPRDFRPNYKELGISLKDPKNMSYKDYINRVGIPPIEGIKEVIKELSKRYVLTVISSNHREVIEHQLNEYGLLKFFKIVMGNGDVSNIKPHPEALLKCLENLELSNEEAIYIGDMVTDIEASRNANMKVISVTWGWNSKAELEEAKSDWIVDSPKELLGLFNR